MANIQGEDLSITAYEEGYLSANAFYSNHTITLPENPYPPGPWRPFLSWKAGWEDYHTELEIIEEQITRKAAGLKIARILKMDNIAHLEQEIVALQQEKENRS